MTRTHPGSPLAGTTGPARPDATRRTIQRIVPTLVGTTGPVVRSVSRRTIQRIVSTLVGTTGSVVRSVSRRTIQRIVPPLVGTSGPLVRTLAAVIFLACTLPAARAQDAPPEPSPTPAAAPPASRPVFSPDNRVPTELPEERRNPFGAAAAPAEEEEAEVVAAETEEARIRRVVGSMRVTGLSGSPGGYTAVLGSMLLREGEPLPRLFANQAEKLRVDSITGDAIVLRFEESNPGIPPERIVEVKVNLAPQVRSVLAGELFQAAIPVDAKGNMQLGPVELEASKSIEKGLKDQNFEGLVERRFKLLSSPGLPTGNERQKPQR